MQKKLIIIGASIWFADSFIYFKEKDFDITVIKAKDSLNWFKDNYEIYRDLGAKVIEYNPDNINELCLSLQLDKNTIVLGGGNFAGDIPSFDIFKKLSIEELELLAKISTYNKENNCGAFVIRFFNGDTGFGSYEIACRFGECLKNVDLLLFDNDLLKEYVLQNVPSLENKPSLIGWLETPLKRYVKHNKTALIEKIFLSMGRVICSSSIKYPATLLRYPRPSKGYKGLERLIKWFYFRIIRGLPDSYHVAGQDSFKNILSDREQFFDKNSSIAFGLSHFYDIFHNSVERFKRNKNFLFSYDGSTMANQCSTPKECYYAFCNNPSKDATYLMNGIIPLISHNLHNVYRDLVARRMAILIKDISDFEKVIKMSNAEIQEYRDNIYKNLDLYTFEPVADNIIQAFENFKNNL